MITANSPFPSFSLLDDAGNTVTEAVLKGQWNVVYFYPKDDTPGCTQEACSIRDSYGEFEKRGVQVIGVSADSVRSHQKFKQKYHLPFMLLADTEHALCETVGVWAQKRMFGKKYMGILRTTFIVNPEGVVTEVLEDVDPAGHGEVILSHIP